LYNLHLCELNKYAVLSVRAVAEKKFSDDNDDSENSEEDDDGSEESPRQPLPLYQQRDNLLS